MKFRRRQKPTQQHVEFGTIEAHSTPEIERFNAVANKIATAFGEHLKDKRSAGMQLINGLSQGLPNLHKGELAMSRATLSVADEPGQAELATFSRAFELPLPEAGIEGVRLLVEGLREQGDARLVQNQPVTSWKEKRLGLRDALPFITEPTLFSTQGIDAETLIMPTGDPNVVVTFEGLGIMQPGADAEEVVTVGVALLPDLPDF